MKFFQKNFKKCLTNRFGFAIIDYADLRGCWNRQTGKLEVLVSVLACGFKSHFPHQCKGHSFFRVSFIFISGKSANYYHQKQSRWNRTKSLILWKRNLFRSVKSLILRKRNLFRSQTGKPQVPQSVLACGFKSHFPHQCKGHSIFRVSFVFISGKKEKASIHLYTEFIHF